MPTDWGYRQVGGVSLPLPTSSANSLLFDCDPAVAFALDYFAFVISTYVGPRLMQAAGGGVMTSIAKPVAQQYPSLPTPDMLDNQLQFPLLCVARTRSMTGRHTAGFEHDRGLFDLLYVLPPMTAAQVELVGPIFHAVYAAIRSSTTQGWDPAYTPPGDVQGGQPWVDAGLEYVGFGDPFRDVAEAAQYGAFEGTGSQVFPSLKMFGYMIERDMPVPGQNKFLGADAAIDLIAPDQTTAAAPFVQVSTQAAPTILSLSPTSGTASGGTSVTLTGTNFLDGPPMVFFGYQRATNVTWNTATSLTVLSPAVSGTGGPVDVSIVNLDGQTATLPASYTFT